MEFKTATRELGFISLFMWSAGAVMLFYVLPNSEKILALSSYENTFFTQEESQVEVVPVRLIIPSIKVNTVIEEVGTTASGSMDVPKDIKNVGWYSSGSVPGEKGSAVIAGHYTWKNKKVSAFDKLYKLRVGEKVYVEDSGGSTTTFIVREVRKYNPEKDTPRVFDVSTQTSHLNLITCGGTWNQETKSYSNRLVVFADKEVE